MTPVSERLCCRPVAYASPEYYATVALRNEILRRPLGLCLTDEEIQAECDNDHHIACVLDGEIVACLVLTPRTERVVRMRQVAVAANCRRRGIGTALVQYAERFAAEHGYGEIVAHVRMTSVPFYETLCYRFSGRRFTEVGIPHVTMRKPLTMGS